MAWHCSYCPNGTHGGSNGFKNHSESHYSFNSQEEFVNHLKTNHLLVKPGKGGKTYVCCYGPSGFCVDASVTPDTPSRTTSDSSFPTQREYEQHLVLSHLLRRGNYRQPELVKVVSTTSTSANSSPDGSRRAWSVYQSVVNLPAVLNDPDHRQLDIFSRTWGDQFERTEVTASPRLMAITEQDFSSYLDKINSPRLFSRRSGGGFSVSAGAQNHPLRGKSDNGPLKMSLSHGRPPKTVLQPESRSAASSLDSIPPAFFTGDFDLRHWRTFAQVVPLQERRPMHPTGASQADASSQQARAESDEDDRGGARCSLGGVSARNWRSLQQQVFHRQHEKLTQYLDIVEMHLAEQVSKKSSVFFEAVFCHDVVREQLKEAILQINVVRSKLACVDAALTTSIMQLHRVVRRRQNCQALLDRLHVVASLQTAQPTIQVLLRQNDFCAALDLIASTRDLLESSPQLTVQPAVASRTTTSAGSSGGGGGGKEARRPGKSQQQLKCLRHLNAQMEEISRIVRQMIVAEFELVLRRFLEAPNSPTARRARSPGEEQAIVDAAMPDLVPCLLGLLHIQRLDFVSAFKAELLRQVKAIVSAPPTTTMTTTASEANLKRANLPTTAVLEETEPLAKEQLRSLSNEAWIEVVADKCIQLDGLLRYAEKAVDVFNTTMQGCASDLQPSPASDVFPARSPCLSPAILANLTGQLTVTLGNVANAAQQHVLLLVSPRLQQSGAVETHTGDGESARDGASDARTDLDSRSLNGKAATADPALATGSRLTQDQLICLVTVLQEFLENTYRTTHYDPAGQAQLSQRAVAPAGADADAQVTESGQAPRGVRDLATTTSAAAATAASKLASLVAFTVRGLIHRFHEDRCQKMKLMLHQERWEAVAVPRQLQLLVHQTFEREAAATQSAPTAWSFRRASTGADPKASRTLGLGSNNSSTAAAARTEGASSPALLLHGEPFMVVGSVLLLLPMLVDYAELATRLPLQPWSVEELADHLAVFLSLFNSGTCELVLGAGATKSAVLQVISARHLAVASRSLQLVARCVPALSAYFKRLAAGWVQHHETAVSNGVETVAGRDAVKLGSSARTSYLIDYLKVHHVRRKQNMLEHVDGLFSEHISGINDKLVQLLSNRISEHLVNWQVRPPTPSEQIRRICKAISRVAQTIGEIIPLGMLTPILLRAHSEFKVKLRERLGQLMVKADGGPQQSLVDSELAFYMQQLRPLSSKLTKFNDDFSDIWPVG